MAYALSLALGLFQALNCFPLKLIRGQTPKSVLTDHGDFLQHIIGQIYFLQEPWRWPFLVAGKLDAPVGTNIAMTDSIPLEALLLKLVHPFFPTMLQGVTLYLALCWVLQPACAVFALRSMGEKRLLPCMAAAVFSACFPTFLFRIGHAALCGQWILLLAVGLYFRATRTTSDLRAVSIFGVLTILTLLIHPYLMVMTGALLGAVPLTLLLRERSWKACAKATFVTVFSGLGLLFLGAVLGYWGGASGGGYGVYSMNLASPFWPVHSNLFPSVSQASTDATGGQYEGYQYLGAGVLLLLGMILITRRGRGLLRQAAKDQPGLFLALASLTAIALSNRIYFFHVPLLLTHFHVPGAEQMRSSGRMFWPVAYAMMLGGVYGLCRVWRRAWPAIIVAAMTLQWYDTRSLRDTDRQTEMALLAPAQAADQQVLALLHPFNRVEIHPRLECDGANASAVMPLIYAAALQNSFVNTMYTARAMPAAACTDASEQPHRLTADTIIILPGHSQRITAIRWSTKEHAKCGIMEDKTFCVSTDSHLLPGLVTLPEAPLLPVDRDIVTSVTKSEHQEILQSGWSGLEPWGVWSETQDPSLYFHLPSDIHTANVVLRLHAAPGTTQHVEVSMNGTDVARWTVGPEDGDYSATFSVPSETHASQMQLKISNPVRIGQDPRLLGVGLLRLRINRIN